MAAIRSVNPDAQLVQTEDLGTTYSTPALAYQATFDNHRRWLTFDILSGHLDEWKPLWWYLLESGITRQELESFLTRPCVPDILGINHYLTSDRYLDDRLELYPTHLHGGNGRHAYADVEAVRTIDEGIRGHAGVLRDAWERYTLPVAVTEVHNGCTRDEQLRWLNEAWQAVSAELYKAASEKARAGKAKGEPGAGPGPEPGEAKDAGKPEEGPIIDAEVVDEKK